MENRIPSGKLTVCYGKSLFLMGKSTISMAIFNSYVWHNQRVFLTFFNHGVSWKKNDKKWDFWHNQRVSHPATFDYQRVMDFRVSTGHLQLQHDAQTGDFWRTLSYGLDTTAELPPERGLVIRNHRQLFLGFKVGQHWWIFWKELGEVSLW